jgi:hypothetical protein
MGAEVVLSCSWWSCPIGDEIVPVAGGAVL